MHGFQCSAVTLRQGSQLLPFAFMISPNIGVSVVGELGIYGLQSSLLSWRHRWSGLSQSVFHMPCHNDWCALLSLHNTRHQDLNPSAATIVLVLLWLSTGGGLTTVSLSADQQASWLNLTVHSEHNHWMQPCNHRLIELLSVHSPPH